MAASALQWFIIKKIDNAIPEIIVTPDSSPLNPAYKLYAFTRIANEILIIAII